tara:strand:+ start:155 stop:301 length:147 start_codon:yes stop_codon:yes gene_type:complete
MRMDKIVLYLYRYKKKIEHYLLKNFEVAVEKIDNIIAINTSQMGSTLG